MLYYKPSIDEDTYIRLSTPVFSYNGAAVIAFGTTLAAADIYRSLLNFGPLTHIPSGSVIASGILTLECNLTLGVSTPCSTYRVIGNWEDGVENPGTSPQAGTSWNNRVDSTSIPWATGGGHYDATPTYVSTGIIPDSTGPKNFNITNVVKGCIANNSDLSILLRANDESGAAVLSFAQFMSLEGATDPFITIYYTPPARSYPAIEDKILTLYDNVYIAAEGFPSPPIFSDPAGLANEINSFPAEPIYGGPITHVYTDHEEGFNDTPALWYDTATERLAQVEYARTVNSNYPFWFEYSVPIVNPDYLDIFTANPDLGWHCDALNPSLYPAYNHDMTVGGAFFPLIADAMDYTSQFLNGRNCYPWVSHRRFSVIGLPDKLLTDDEWIRYLQTLIDHGANGFCWFEADTTDYQLECIAADQYIIPPGMDPDIWLERVRHHYYALMHNVLFPNNLRFVPDLSTETTVILTPGTTTFLKPNGVTILNSVECYGAGGDGGLGDESSTGGGGGGGGGYAKYNNLNINGFTNPISVQVPVGGSEITCIFNVGANTVKADSGEDGDTDGIGARGDPGIGYSPVDGISHDGGVGGNQSSGTGGGGGGGGGPTSDGGSGVAGGAGGSGGGYLAGDGGIANVNGENYGAGAGGLSAPFSSVPFTTGGDGAIVIKYYASTSSSGPSRKSPKQPRHPRMPSNN